MSFRLRLAVFFVATLVAVQLFTAGLLYEVTRRQVIADGEHQLTASARTFARQLNDIAERIADSVQVLSLDYALRSAIAERDHDTVLSVLRNHGRRVGAARMLLIALDGTIEVDTSPLPLSGRFPFPDLIDSAFTKRSATVVALDGKAYWMTVVPINAPQPIALIAAGIPMDNELLHRLEQSASLPRQIELAARDANGKWTVLARESEDAELTAPLASLGKDLPQQPRIVAVGGNEYVALAQPLDRQVHGTPVVAVVGYSLDEALQHYRPIVLAWAGLLTLGLAIGLIVTMLIARGVSRPLETLANAAHRIEAGDYSIVPAPTSRDEIGQLAIAFSTMTRAIRERELAIRDQADHDAATGLLNRAAADSRILLMLNTPGHEHGALLMIGLARLPEVIKTLGHALGDRLMRELGRRLYDLGGNKLLARATDTQFLLWLPDADRDAAVDAARKVLARLSTPYQEDDLAIDPAPAVGIALHPDHGQAASTLLQHADVALVRAQRAPDPVEIYDPANDPHRPERLVLMGELRSALSSDQIRLHFQPKVRLQSGRVDGAEALIRWQHPRRGFVPPDAFISLAEETGNIRHVTRWALNEAAMQIARWKQGGLDLRIAVNLSARDLDDKHLPDQIAEWLKVHSITGENLTLEITESAVMGEPETAIQVLRRLADHGISVAIDDFGIGQSSFAYLRRLSVNEIKIDKTFVQKLGSDDADRIIVRAIVDLGHRLGYKVTAEGVEDEASYRYLAEIGCDHAQGWLIAKAMAADQFNQFMASSRWAVPT